MDNLHYRLTFDLDNKNEIPGKNLVKAVNSKISLKNVVMRGKYSFAKFANFLIIVLRAEIATIFEPKVVTISTRNTIMGKYANFVRLYFPHITTFFKQILEYYYF